MSAFEKGSAPRWSNVAGDEPPNSSTGGYPMAPPNYWTPSDGHQPTPQPASDANTNYPGNYAMAPPPDYWNAEDGRQTTAQPPSDPKTTHSGCPAPDQWEGNWNQTTTPPSEWTADPDRDLVEFTEKTLRRGFVRKVFAILAAQLLVTFGIMAIFVLVDSVKLFVQDNLWIMIAACITTFVLIIALACSEKLRRAYPQNLICLIIFTLAEAWLLGATASYFDADEVLMAAGICTAVTFVMCLFGLQSKIDLTVMTGGLIVITMCLLGFGILCAIFQDRYLQLAYASIGALVFSLWIAVDIQLVMGKGKYQLDSEEYILAALNIYLDIINLFVFILQIIGLSK